MAKRPYYVSANFVVNFTVYLLNYLLQYNQHSTQKNAKYDKILINIFPYMFRPILAIIRGTNYTSRNVMKIYVVGCNHVQYTSLLTNIYGK
jgi:hypothetical protein